MDSVRLWNGVGAGIVLLLAAVQLTACSGQGAIGSVRQTEPPVSLPVSNPADIALPNLPAFPSITAVGSQPPAPRAGRVLESLSLAGDEVYEISAPAVLDANAHTAVLYTADEGLPWASYRFDGLLNSEKPLRVSLDLLPPLGESFFLGVSDFAQQAWHWQQVTIVDGQCELQIPAELSTVNAAGQVYFCLVAQPGEFVEIARIELGFDQPAPYPLELSASDGTYLKKIELNWEDPAVTYEGLAYDWILLYRYEESLEGWIGIASLLPGTTSFADETTTAHPLPVDQPVAYRARTVVDGRVGPVSPEATGFRSWGEFSYQATNGDYADKVVISWTEKPFVDEYRVTINQGGEFIELATITDPAVTGVEHRWDWPVGLECEYGVTYKYRVVPVSGAEELQSTTSKLGRRELQWPFPQDVSQGSYPDKVVVSWIWSTPPPAAYKIYRDGTREEHLVAIAPVPDVWEDTQVDQFQHAYYMRAFFQNDESHISYANYGFKAGSQWQSHTVGPGLHNFGYKHSDAAVIAGKPAAIQRVHSGKDPAFKYSYSLAVEPTAPEDWVTSILPDSISGSSFTLVEVDSTPAVIYSDYHLMFAAASKPTPSNNSDWEIHEVDETSFGSRIAAVVDTNRILVCYRAGDGIRFASSDDLHPSDSSDWQIHLVNDDVGTVDAISLALVANKPAAGYRRGSRELVFALASTANPASAADWQIHQVSDECYSGPLVTEYGGRPVVYFVAFLDEGWLLRPYSLVQAKATVDSPSSAQDWTISIVDGAYSCIGPQALAYIDQPPSLIYTSFYSTSDGSYSTVKLAQATVAEPEDAADWLIQPIETQLNASPSVSQLLAIDGRLLAFYTTELSSEAGAEQVLRCASLPED